MAKRDKQVTAAPDSIVDGHLVVIGASAGGVEALSALVATIPHEFPAPIVVAQHLDPRRTSHLGDILSQHATLPVLTVADQAELKPGWIHVVPSNRHVEVTGRDVRLVEPSADSAPVPSIDVLLTSAASAFGEALIAVILTGSGSDGAEGARTVKTAGGTVVIQDPDTARYPSMPASLAPTTVDISAPIELIGQILYDLVTGVLGPDDDAQLLARFLDELRRRSGIDFTSYKQATILRRLQRRMVATGSHRLRDYTRYVSTNPDEYQRLASAFLIKVTEFFRDPDLFETVRDRLLPELIDEARDRKELRLWSAGCATGEEAYSLAMIVRDALGEELGDWSVRIFATDLDAEAVAFARRGIYPPAALSRLPDSLVTRHFIRLEGEYEVRPEVRALVIFGQHDLALRAPFPRIDLVVCRNVLIYFTEELQRRALQVFAFSLRDGGILLLGKAETTTPLTEHFVVVDQRLKIFRRHGDRTVIPPFRLRDTPAPARFTPQLVPRSPLLPPPAIPVSRVSGRAALALASLPIGVAVVTRDYDIEYLNPIVRRLLGIHGPAVGQDVVHVAARMPATELQAALDEALAGHTATITATITSGADDRQRVVEVTCAPIAEDGQGGQPSGAVLTVRDVTTERAATDELAGALARDDEQLAAITRRLDSLREESRQIGVANEELAATNAELRFTNEALLVANEEVQAAGEEVETLNEELQATNEELETLNEELQATVEELHATNEDLQARGVKLQNLTTDLDEQRLQALATRARMEAVIETLQEGVLVVDGRGETVVRNDTFQRLVDVEGVQPHDPDGRQVSLTSIAARAVAGEVLEWTFSQTSDTGRHRWFELQARPVPAEMRLEAGAIIVIRDITDVSLRRLQEEFVGVVAHELRTPLTALRGYLQMLGRSGVDDASRPKLQMAIGQAERLHHLVDELFDITLADSGHLEINRTPTDLRELVSRTVEIVRGVSDRHRFSVDEPDATLLATVDPDRIQQVLLNVLTNAIIHAPDAPDVSIRLRRLRRRVEIEIEDHGPGISAEAQQRLFTRFERGEGSTPGLGLGLYIARQIVEAHGGTLDVDSAPGEGATFTIRLPLAATDRPSAARDGDGVGPGLSRALEPRSSPGGSESARSRETSHRRRS